MILMNGPSAKVNSKTFVLFGAHESFFPHHDYIKKLEHPFATINLHKMLTKVSKYYCQSIKPFIISTMNNLNKMS